VNAWLVQVAAGNGPLFCPVHWSGSIQHRHIALSSPVGRRLIVLLSAPVAAFLFLYQARGVGGGPWSNYSITNLLLIVPISFAVFITAALFLGPIERMLRLVRHGNR
jgi:hypothetical protein